MSSNRWFPDIKRSISLWDISVRPSAKLGSLTMCVRPMSGLALSSMGNG
jgi:hypothetical protein